MKNYRKKILSTFKKWNYKLYNKIVCKKATEKKLLLIIIILILTASALEIEGSISEKKSLQTIKNNESNQEKARQQIFEKFEKESINRISTVQDKIDSSSWEEFKSNWYGFKIKYPQNWKAPLIKQFKNGSNADYRISFMTNDQNNKNYVGFDVAVYSISRIKELSATDEFPETIKNIIGQSSQYNLLEIRTSETGDYPAEKIYIPSNNNCDNSVLFFSVIYGQYIYNITPILKEGIKFNDDPTVIISDDLPEFFEAVSQFENIDIIRPSQASLSQPKIKSPMPVSYNKDNLGRLVCDKKKDKPKKSKKDKGKHLDMECCLDPDEYPNPNCYYDPAKYGKYLK